MSHPKVTREMFWSWHHEQVSRINSCVPTTDTTPPPIENNDDAEVTDSHDIRHHWLISRLCDPFVLEDGSMSIWSAEEKKAALQLGIDLNVQRSKLELTAIRDKISDALYQRRNFDSSDTLP